MQLAADIAEYFPGFGKGVGESVAVAWARLSDPAWGPATFLGTEMKAPVVTKGVLISCHPRKNIF